MENYTFGQAKRALRSAAYLHGDGDIGEQINNAIMSLAGLNGWEFLRRLVRTFSASPVFSLPQGTAELTRVCVNGRPASLHPTDYQFLHSGPGDLDRYIARGFSVLPGNEVADEGFFPIMTPLTGVTYLCAVSAYVTEENPSGELRPQPPVTVSGILSDGTRVTRSIPVIQGTHSAFPAVSSFDMDNPFATIDGVVLNDSTDEHITLYGLDERGSMSILAHYHPDVKVPQFHRYRILSPVPPPYDILAEVRVAPLPMVDDNDIIPIPSLEPIKHMILYQANLAMNELQTAQMYMQQAMQWLQQMQQADNTIQTPVVQNVLFDGGSGLDGDMFLNL